MHEIIFCISLVGTAEFTETEAFCSKYHRKKILKKTTVILLNTRSFYNQCNYFAISDYNRNTIFSCFIPFNTCYCLKLQQLYIHFTTIGKLNTIILQCSILGLKTQLLCMGHRWCVLSIVKPMCFCHFYSKITTIDGFCNGCKRNILSS